MVPHQEIPHSPILLKPNFQLCFHNIPPLVLILRQINPVHVLTAYFFKSHCSIILPSMPRFFKREPQITKAEITYNHTNSKTIQLYIQHFYSGMLQNIQ
jgi:hypothetical protein